jgi:hypothetical protein
LTEELQKKDLQPRLHFHRMTLSFLPGDQTGWKFDNVKETTAETPLGTKFVRRLELQLPDGRWPVDLIVTSRFDRADKRISPIEAQLVGSHSAGKPKAEQKDAVVDPKPLFGDDANDNKKSRARQQEKKARPTRDAKRQDQQHAEPDDESAPEQRPRATGRRDDHAFILELFRRYGRLCASVVVRVQNGSSNEEVEILRFGKAPSLPNP